MEESTHVTAKWSEHIPQHTKQHKIYWYDKEGALLGGSVCFIYIFVTNSTSASSLSACLHAPEQSHSKTRT